MIIRGLITVLVLLALTLSSFGHRTLAPMDEARANAFILAGGDWATLCGDGDDPLNTATKCMACIMSQSCALPPAAVTATKVFVGDAMVWPRVADQPVGATQTQAHPARAPPFA